jgi:hypothetical protein
MLPQRDPVDGGEAGEKSGGAGPIEGNTRSWALPPLRRRRYRRAGGIEADGDHDGAVFVIRHSVHASRDSAPCLSSGTRFMQVGKSVQCLHPALDTCKANSRQCLHPALDTCNGNAGQCLHPTLDTGKGNSRQCLHPALLHAEEVQGNVRNPALGSCKAGNSVQLQVGDSPTIMHSNMRRRLPSIDAEWDALVSTLRHIGPPLVFLCALLGASMAGHEGIGSQMSDHAGSFSPYRLWLMVATWLPIQVVLATSCSPFIVGPRTTTSSCEDTTSFDS